MHMREESHNSKNGKFEYYDIKEFVRFFGQCSGKTTYFLSETTISQDV